MISKKEKAIQIALGTYLPLIWKERNKIIAEAYKQWAEAEKFYDERNLPKDRSKSLLHLRAQKHYSKGNNLYRDTVREIYGPYIDAGIIWNTGEVIV